MDSNGTAPLAALIEGELVGVLFILTGYVVDVLALRAS
jgi:hypothetical protein